MKRRSGKAYPVIYLAGLGTVSGDILSAVERFLVRYCGEGSVTVEFLDLPSSAFNAERRQYNAKTLLTYLLEKAPSHALKAIGITLFDLYLPMLKYVYGSAQVDGKGAVFSLHRLRPGFYSEKEAGNERLFDCRIEKTALHEMAHTFGLTHCQDPSCVMFSSTHIEDTDCKNPEFCASCRELFEWKMKRSS